MYNIPILNETISNGYSYNILYTIFLLLILCGIMVIISKNPIVSILFLIGLFISISTFFIMLGYNFMELSYLLVYVSAVSGIIILMSAPSLINYARAALKLSYKNDNNKSKRPVKLVCGSVDYPASGGVYVLIDLYDGSGITLAHIFGNRGRIANIRHNNIVYKGIILSSLISETLPWYMPYPTQGYQLAETTPSLLSLAIERYEIDNGYATQGTAAYYYANDMGEFADVE